jgi:hypothetical protein
VFPTNTFTVTGFSLSTSSVKGGNGLTGTVSFSGSPPLGGAIVLLASDNLAVQVPATVSLGFGQSSASFSISTAAVSDPQSSTITATYGESTLSATLSVKPLLTIALAPSAVTGGTAVTGTISLFDAAPSGGAEVVLQSTDSALAAVPASVKIPAGQSSASFTVATASVTSSTTVAITASYSGVKKPVLLTLNPSGLPAPTSLTLSSNIVKGGSSSKGTVTLSAPAPSGGLPVDLQTDNPFTAQVPAVLIIASGQNSASFTINTVSVSTTQTVTISASLGGASKTAPLTVQQ